MGKIYKRNGIPKGRRGIGPGKEGGRARKGEEGRGKNKKQETRGRRER